VLRVLDPEQLPRARAAVRAELAAIDLACSRFRPDSELMQLNHGAGTARAVSPLLLEAIEMALRAAELTDGDVDPTVGRALELAGYDRDWSLLEPAGRACERAPRLRARAVPGWRALALERSRSSVRLPAGVRLDLGSTAKAWAADRAARSASEAACCGVLVSVGGDVASAGEAPACGWSIRVSENHRDGADAPGQTVQIESGAIATSSTGVRRWSHEGRTMHHIIDPSTGAPVRETWRTVSVAAATCADANIAATAAIVRAGKAVAWLEQLGLPARLQHRSGHTLALCGWPAQSGRRAA
jgi:thiamine biosynthesis lipoprotein